MSGSLLLLINSNTVKTKYTSNIFRRSGPLLLRRAVRPGFSGALYKWHLRVGHVDGLAPSSTTGCAFAASSLLRKP